VYVAWCGTPLQVSSIGTVGIMLIMYIGDELGGELVTRVLWDTVRYTAGPHNISSYTGKYRPSKQHVQANQNYVTLPDQSASD